MGETPLQNLTPEPLSYVELVRSGWAGWTRADIVGTYDPDSWISRGITASEAAILGGDAQISHSMLYLGGGRVLDQQLSLEVGTLEQYTGHLVRRYTHPFLSAAQRDHVVAESLVFHLGSAYDLQIIPAHLLEAILGIDALAERVHDPDHFDCSEGVCHFMRYADPAFMGDRECTVMPQEINDYCIREGWEIATFLLVE